MITTSFIATPGSIWYALQTVVAIAIAAIFIMSIVSFFLAIWDFIRSEWEEETKKKWWNRIRFMMVGILLTIFFLFMLPLLIKYLGIDGYQMFNAQNIFSRIGELMNQLLNISWEVQKYYDKDSSFWWLGGSLNSSTVIESDYTL